MKKIIGTSNRILEIDLTTRKFKIFSITPPERRLYLGGKGLGLKLLYDRLQPGIDPLDEKNILVFMMGVFMGTGAPCSARFAAVTKSPLTGIISTCSCGGPFGMALKTAGFDGLLVKGKSNEPVYLQISAETVRFEDASKLWGKDTEETQAALNLTKPDGALVIGPAGENKVLYANIASGHRFLGRSGMGAVMGAKKLKAIVANGRAYKIVPADPKQFQKLRKKANLQINRNDFTGVKYRKLGTASHVNMSNAGGILPVMNFKGGSHERAHEISGEVFEKKFQPKPSTCIPCSILCGHKGTYSDGVHRIPEYETIGVLGPNLGIFDPVVVTEWNDLANKFGLDTISLGTTLSYVMEAGEKGLLTTDLKFGQATGISSLIKDIAFRKGVGNEIANGTRRLAEKYGGKNFAIHIKGLEMAAYDPRGSWGQGLAYAVANRGGCHLSAAMFALEVYFGLLNPHTTRAKIPFVNFFEGLNTAVNSLDTCMFTLYAYVLEALVVRLTPKPLLAFTMQNLPKIALQLIDVTVYSKMYQAITGLKLSQKEFLKAGHRIHTLERFMNTREGISRKDDVLPGRFLNEGRDCDPKKQTVPLDKMLDAYYKQRGYDQNGIPTRKTLEKYGIVVKTG